MQLAFLAMAFLVIGSFVDGTVVQHEEGSVGKVRLSKAAQSGGDKDGGVKNLLLKRLWLTTLLGASSQVDAGLFGRGPAGRHGSSGVANMARNDPSLHVQLDNTPAWDLLNLAGEDLQEWTDNGNRGEMPQMPTAMKNIERDSKAAFKKGLSSFVGKVTGAGLSGDPEDISALATEAFTSVSGEIDSIMAKAYAETKDGVINRHGSKTRHSATASSNADNIASRLAESVLNPDGRIMEGAGDAEHLVQFRKVPWTLFLKDVIENKAAKLLNSVPAANRESLLQGLATGVLQTQLAVVDKLKDFVESKGGEWHEEEYSEEAPDVGTISDMVGNSRFKVKSKVSW